MRRIARSIEVDCYVTEDYQCYVTAAKRYEARLMPLTNAERQKRFRELTLRERQMKADAFERLLAMVDSDVKEDEIPLIDGRSLKVTRRDGEVVLQVVANAKMQLEIQRSRLRLLYGG